MRHFQRIPKHDKPDANQKPIVRDLRRLGYHVEIIGWPADLVVAAHGRNFLFEVKTETGSLGRSKRQREWWLKPWGGQRDVIRSTEDALRIIAAETGEIEAPPVNQ